ncbi:MAG: hypothetical protein R3D63_13635 [Paracoccaceae bacterium]
MGFIHQAEQDFDGALQAFQARRDPGWPSWCGRPRKLVAQRELAICIDRIGQSLPGWAARGAGGLQQTALEIRRKTAAADPGFKQYQLDYDLFAVRRLPTWKPRAAIWRRPRRPMRRGGADP